MSLKLQNGSKWVLIGDSITDAGRAQPLGEGGGLGNGYVAMIDALLGATYPEARLRLINVGSSGNTVRDLEARWERYVLAQKPDWLSVMIGINDVWRQFDSPLRPEGHVLADEYERIYDSLIERTRGSVKGLILATPFYIEPLKEDAMRRRMDEYGGIVRRLAEKHGAIFVDTQAAFDEVLRTVSPHWHGTAFTLISPERR